MKMLTALKVVAVSSVFVVSSTILRSHVLGVIATAGFIYAYDRLSEGKDLFD